MDGQIQVTVIATGFTSEASPEVEEPEEEDEGEDIIRYKDWLKMREGIVKRTPHEYLIGRNTEETDLGIPTVLRDDRKPGDEKAQ